MARLLVFVFALSTTGCLVDPTLYPYRPLDSDSGSEGGLDAGPDVDGADQTMLRDDGGAADAGGRVYEECRGTCACDTSCALDCDDKKCEPTCSSGATCALESLGKKSKVECKDADTVCDPIVCLDECDVNCNAPGGTCIVFCEGSKTCDLTCDPAAGECRIEGCEDLVQCDDGWVCNGRC